MARSLLILLALVVLSSVSCSERPECPEYPTTLRPLQDEILEALRADFYAENPRICSLLNEYGFTDHFCIRRVGIPERVDTAAFISRARATIVANARYTGVADPCWLSEISHFYLDDTYVQIDFASQAYAGLEVVGSFISVLMDSLGVFSINGHYFPYILVPPEPLVAAAEAQESILRLTITYSDWHGDLHTFVIAADSFLADPTKAVLRHQEGDAIELRVAWRVPVGPAGEPHAWWDVYVDTMDGEMLWIHPLFAI